MRKQDLAGLNGTGRLVQTRNENVFLITNDFLIRSKGFTRLGNFADDLTNTISEDFDIMRVSNVLQGSSLVPKCWTSETITDNLFWERKETLPYNAWYKHTHGAIVYFTGETSGWGISGTGIWSNCHIWLPLSCGDWTPATEEEVEEMLIDYAKSRGYKNGNYKCLYMPNNTGDSTGDIEFMINSSGVWIYGDICSNLVFNGKTGVWAEIIESPIPEYTWDEIKEKLGHNFTVKN